jgi:hypothetical protein
MGNSLFLFRLLGASNPEKNLFVARFSFFPLNNHHRKQNKIEKSWLNYP